MLNNSKKVLAIALAALFLSTPLVSTASAAASDFVSPKQIELRSNHHNPPGSHRAPSHSVRHAPAPRHASHDRGRHYGHHKPAPPPRHHKHHHHHNDKLIGGLIAGAVIGAVIANNS